MFLDRPPLIYVWRPFYRFVSDRLIGGQYLRLRRLLFFDPLSGEAAKDSAVDMLRSLTRTAAALEIRQEKLLRQNQELLTRTVAALEIRQEELLRQNQELLARAAEMDKHWSEMQESWQASEALWLSLIQNAQRGGYDGRPPNEQ